MQEGVQRSLAKPLMLRKGNTMGNVKKCRCVNQEKQCSSFITKDKEGKESTK